jgi:hypothetical protein
MLKCFEDDCFLKKKRKKRMDCLLPNTPFIFLRHDNYWQILCELFCFVPPPRARKNSMWVVGLDVGDDQIA